MKNPWMSLWLSAANRTAATARGHWLAEARRQQAALTKQVEKAAMSGVPLAPKPARKRRTRRD
jgi:hypothetical protein